MIAIKGIANHFISNYSGVKARGAWHFNGVYRVTSVRCDLVSAIFEEFTSRVKAFRFTGNIPVVENIIIVPIQAFILSNNPSRMFCEVVMANFSPNTFQRSKSTLIKRWVVLGGKTKTTTSHAAK